MKNLEPQRSRTMTNAPAQGPAQSQSADAAPKESSGTAGGAPLLVDATWDLHFQHAAGPHTTRFLAGLRDEKKIWGIRCTACHKVLVPPRAFHEECFADTGEWVAVSDEGVIDTMTIQYESFPGLPPAPYAIGLIRLDGADTTMLAFLGGVPLADPEVAQRKIGVGCRVKAVWRADRRGAITDIERFEPL
ncbi:MAG: Zn-ribbon domain-containing OB-fold protein [Thermoplasmatota archaeon]